MSTALAPVAFLLTGVAFLLLGNGLQNTLLSVRAGIEGFPTPAVGALMSAYFAGYVAGSLWCPGLIRRVGHIRAYAALASVASAAALFQALLVAPWAWALLRFVCGVCFAGLFVGIESWLNGRTTNETRGAVLGVYMAVCLTATALGQQFLRLASPAGFELFLLTAALISLSVLPVALTSSTAPALHAAARLGLRQLYRRSPLGVVGCLATGAANGTLWSLAPLFGHQTGLTPGGIATFLGATVAGGAALQWPLGRLSDRLDRRAVIRGATFAGCAAGVAIASCARSAPGLLPLLGFLYGAGSLTLYSLCVAHANDRVEESTRVEASQGLLLAYGVGATVGPLSASGFMALVGPAGLFACLAGIAGGLAVFASWRIGEQAPVPDGRKEGFVPVPETSPVALAMVPQGGRRLGARERDPPGAPRSGTPPPTPPG